ncbi:hypothetical protein GCM10023091_22100 [Ravibacter arvi]|uniref:Anti-sigma factor n=1 Tax=Ravibacter arvi TaxID=2051041 RepID=A0ABP8M0P0_9BACT
MKTHKQYGFSDFHRYHFNEMTPEEQYQFEEEMLDDSFLREAYEGFEMMLNDGVKPGYWKEKLQHGTPAVKTTVRRSWPYVAAAFLLITGGFLIYHRPFFFPLKQESAFLPDTIYQPVEPGIVTIDVTDFHREIKTKETEAKKFRLSTRQYPPAKLYDAPPVAATQTDSALDEIVIVGFGKLPGDTSTSDERLATYNNSQGEVMVARRNWKQDRKVTVRTDSAALIEPNSARFPIPYLKDEALYTGRLKRKPLGERLASHPSAGTTLIIRGNRGLGREDTLSHESVKTGYTASYQDTIQPKKIYLSDTERENWEQRIRRATRNALIYGEGVRFGILSLPDSTVRDFTHDELDELKRILIKIKEERKQKKPEISP